ncbi:unnamed protein product [Microthlaspi erraticum]|uniref:F-box domain-containing protein n=1 Tax=Microthlaspi erraticum TaxID=1685480 RepID=A0A6D2IM04_9BRAS|nr:unnamed protein product [Microthlaspi erraticum]
MISEEKMKTSHSLSFSSLPEEIAENCLARISKYNYPLLSLVSKSFHSLLSSPKLFTTRSHIGTTETCLYICINMPNNSSPQWFTLWMKHEETLTNKDDTLKDFSLIPLHFLPPSPFVPPHDSTVVFGSEIYVIGGLTAPSSSVRILDCRSHTWRDAPSMTVARQNARAVLLENEIYVMGGCETNRSDNTFEVFDIKTQTWSVLPSPILDHNELQRHIAVNAVQGKIFVVVEKTEYTYEPKSGTWEVVGEESCQIHVICVIENVMYGYPYMGDLMWYDYEGRKWKKIKGLEKLREYLKSGWSMPKIVNYGGKIVVMWWRMTEIWCVQIALEKHVGGEIGGKIEWLNAVIKVPGLHCCLNCVASVSI